MMKRGVAIFVDTVVEVMNSILLELRLSKEIYVVCILLAEKNDLNKSDSFDIWGGLKDENDLFCRDWRQELFM